MFEFPYYEDAKSYTLVIMYDSVQGPKAQEILVKKEEKFPVSLVKGLPLDSKYKWYVETNLKSGKKEKSEFHYFSILKPGISNAKLYRKVQHYNIKNKIMDGIVWCDQYRCAVDRQGNIVWFFSEAENESAHAKLIRDFQLYPDGSVSFVNKPNAGRYDIDFNPIWKAPYEGVVSESPREDYHHAMELLPNGNYMILGTEKVNFSNENPGDTVLSDQVDFCNIIEFDKTGKIVWSWRMKDYFPYEFLVDSKIPSPNGVLDPHANAFCIDEKADAVYLSFRDPSRIIKIDKKTKKIIASYGAKLADEDDVIETDIFRLQHDIHLLENNDMLMFNNNDVDSGKISSVEIIHLPRDANDKLYSRWKFELNYDQYSDGKVKRMGSVKILPNGNYLICEGSSNRIVEISPKKEVLWDFAIQQIDSLGRVNEKFGLYRANFSSSLYPNYFTCYTKSGNELIILNKGVEKDSYTVKVTNAKGEVIFTEQTSGIATDKSLTIKLPKGIEKPLSIEITSKNTGKSKSI